MKSTDCVGITFANLLLGTGSHEGVINLTLGAFQFTPNMEAKTVETDPVIVARLRLTKLCATELRDRLTALLGTIADSEADAARITDKPKDEKAN